MSSDHDCSIAFHDLDTEPYTLFIEDIVTARKHHSCCECQEHICPGQKYERVKGLCDGSWSSHKTCLRCLTLRKHYCPDGYIFGALFQTIRDALGPEYLETVIPKEACLDCLGK